MLTDPITIAAGFPVTGSVPAISREPNKSVYRVVSAGKTYLFTISHQNTKTRLRTMIRLDVSDIASDPLVPANSRPRSITTYLVIDHEPGFSSVADVVSAVTSLHGFMATSTFANFVNTTLTRIVSGES